MRGFYSDPSRLNTLRGERGWAARQAAAQEKLQGNAEWRALDAERQAMIAENERQAMADVERRRAANARLRVSCPCCGFGAVPVEQAELVLAALDRAPVNEDARLLAKRENDTRPCPICDNGTVDSEMAGRIVEALSRLPANREFDSSRLGNLYAVAKGETYYGPDAIRPVNGAHRPRRAPAVAAEITTPAAIPADPLVREQADETPAPVVMEPVRRYVLPPHLLEE